MSAARIKRWLGVLFRIVLVAVIFTVIVRKLDMQQAANAVCEAKPLWLVMAFALFLLNRLLTAAKWGLLLRQGGVDVRFWPLVRIMFESNLLGILIPSGLGVDVARLFQLGKEKNALTASAGAVLADRMLAVLTLTLFALLAALTMWSRVPDTRVLVYVLLISLGLGSVILCMMADTTFRFYARLHRLVAHLLVTMHVFPVERVERVSGRILESAGKIHGSLSAVRRDVPLLGLSIGMNVLVQFFRVLQVHFLFMALSTQVPFLLAVAFVPVIILISLMPFCPYMGLGVREASFIFFFGGVGVTSEIAFSTSILSHVVVLAGCIPGALLFLLRKRSPPKMVA